MGSTSTSAKSSARSSAGAVGLAVRLGLAYVNGVREDEMAALVGSRPRGRLSRRRRRRLALGRQPRRLGTPGLGGRAGLPAAAGRAPRALLERRTPPAPAREAEWNASSPCRSSPAATEVKPLGGWEEPWRATAHRRQPRQAPDRDAAPLTGEGRRELADLKRIATAPPWRSPAWSSPASAPTAKGITFMLLEDEFGAVNLVVPCSVYEERRSVVRAAPLVHARGGLEIREGAINVVVTKIEALEWREPEEPEAQPHERSGPRRPRSRGRGEELARRRARKRAVAELCAVAPAGHSFGRRGR